MKNDLRGFLEALQSEQPQDFARVEKPVNADREPAALLKRLEADGRSPVLWLERVGESNFPLVTNVHGTLERLGLALNVEAQHVNSIYAARLQNLIEPVLVQDAPCQEVIKRGEEVNLQELPLVTPSDNCVAPYLGGGIIVARDCVSGIRNLSFNRLMLRGRNRVTFHAAPGQHLHTILHNAELQRTEAEVAIIIGCHPSLALGALAKVPFDVDEYSCAGALLQEPVPLVPCVSVNLEVPAYAEIILEGKVLLDVREPEGPYDEFTGYAMPADLQPVIEITAMTHRRQAIYQDIFGGSREHLLMGAVPKEAMLLTRLRGSHPAVNDVHYPLAGNGRVHAVVSLGPHPAGEARRVIVSAFAVDHFLKHVFVVNDDADIRSNEAVLWTMATCFQGDADMIVLERMQGTSLDPSAQPGGVGAKVGFDCTRKKPDFPQRNKVSAEIMKSMNPSSYL